MQPRDVVLAYWSAMQTNDFASASEWLAESIVIDWPQSRERLHGRANFTAFNKTYPAIGRWRFTLDRIIVEGRNVVTDVVITDGNVVARALSFVTVENGLIARITEYWPEDYAAPEWRAALVQRY